MIKNTYLSAFFALFLLLGVQLQAQTDYAGDWNGAIEIPGIKLEIAIQLKHDKPEWTGALDIPLQHAKGLKLADLQITGKKIQFKLPDVPGNASFAGEFNDSGQKMEGIFSQSGQSFPMKLTRADALEKLAAEKRLQDAVATIKKLSDSLMQLRNMPGFAFGIVKDGQILMSEGFGYRDIEKKLPVTPNTQFAIGSSSKAFTALSLAILADRGAFDWEKPIINYLPDFKLYDDFATKEMTATDLVCHRSGLPRHDMMWYGSAYTRKDIYDRLRYLPPNKSLRTTWQYNNLMFMTAGILVERLSNQSWEDFIKNNIFQPLGMTHSNCSVNDLKKYEEAAIGYNQKDKVNTRLEYRNLDAIGPAGSINSTLTDMMQWVKLHLNKGKQGNQQIVSEAETQHLHTPQMLMPANAFAKSPELTDPSYAMGWFVYRQKGVEIVEHGGNIDGFTALVYMAPEKDFGLVILSNLNGAALPALLAHYATDLVLNLGYTDWYGRTYGAADKKEDDKDEQKPQPKRIADTQPSHALDAYIGEYEHPGYGKATVSKDGKNLQIHFNAFDLTMEHWHYDVFHAENKTLEADMMLNFQTDLNGSVFQFNVNLDPSAADVVFTKAASANLSDPAFLDRLTGKYAFNKEAINITIERRNKTLYATVPGQPVYTLEPYQGTEFKFKGLNGFSIEFTIPEKGKVMEASVIQPNGVFKVTRER
jgi:CubicO group peptidase (beta-lactamase class C family)